MLKYFCPILCIYLKHENLFNSIKVDGLTTIGQQTQATISETNSVIDKKIVDPLTTPHLFDQNKKSSYESENSICSQDIRKSKINYHKINMTNEKNPTTPHLPVSNSISNGMSQQPIDLNQLSQAKHYFLNTSFCKSNLSAGYRYTSGRLQAVQPIPCQFEKQYLFETLVNNPRSPLWDQMQFWEDVFLDAVSQERDIIGLDQGPPEMMERYNQLGNAERKRLELDEDHLLAVMLFNLVAFMIMMRVGKEEIKRKIRRMLGKSHIGLSMSQQVNEILDNVSQLSANDVDLRPAGSRLMQKQSFTVHDGIDNRGDMMFMEVCADCIILRSCKGEICQRWWFEKLVNMTYCPKTKVLCLWCKTDGETKLNKFYTKKCRELYFSIKETMEKAASRLNNSATQVNTEMSGEYTISSLETNQSGFLRITMNGIYLTFDNGTEFIELKRVRKCTTQKDDVFVLEEYGMPME